MPSWTRALQCVELSCQGFMEDTAVRTQWQGLVRKVTQWQFPWFVFETSVFKLFVVGWMFPSLMHVCTLVSSSVVEGGDENGEYMNISIAHCLEIQSCPFACYAGIWEGVGATGKLFWWQWCTIAVHNKKTFLWADEDKTRCSYKWNSKIGHWHFSKFEHISYWPSRGKRFFFSKMSTLALGPA